MSYDTWKTTEPFDTEPEFDDGPEERFDAAHRIIADNVSALATAHAALRHAREALAWYHALAFEKDGVPVSNAIDRALTKINGA